jgi:RNA polymerase subunit RPABC4/transcription elongation factor Spt4
MKKLKQIGKTIYKVAGFVCNSCGNQTMRFGGMKLLVPNCPTCKSYDLTMKWNHLITQTTEELPLERK